MSARNRFIYGDRGKARRGKVRWNCRTKALQVVPRSQRHLALSPITEQFVVQVLALINLKLRPGQLTRGKRRGDVSSPFVILNLCRVTICTAPNIKEYLKTCERGASCLQISLGRKSSKCISKSIKIRYRLNDVKKLGTKRTDKAIYQWTG